MKKVIGLMMALTSLNAMAMPCFIGKISESIGEASYSPGESFEVADDGEHKKISVDSEYSAEIHSFKGEARLLLLTLANGESIAKAVGKTNSRTSVQLSKKSAPNSQSSNGYYITCDSQR